MDTKNKNTYELDDILIASFCLTKGVNLLGIVEDRPGHFKFVLSNPEKCFKFKIDYLNNATAPALELFAKRTLLLSEMKNRNGKGDYKSGRL